MRALLEIPVGNTEEDLKLSILIEQASSWIEEFANRKFLLQSRTEYYNGTGTQKLNLRNRPVFTTPAIQVYEDEAGYWGSASGSFDATSSLLTYGTDYALWIDQDDGSSRSGILIRLGTFWPRNFVRTPGLLAPFQGPGYGCIKVVYSGGYTVDTLPAAFRFACNNLIARMRNLMPLGAELGSESYQERSINYLSEKKDYLLSESGIRPIINSYKNRYW